MIAAAPSVARLPLSPACLAEQEVADVLTRLERARASLSIAEREASRHASAANNLVGLSCLLQLVVGELDQAQETVERAALRA